MTGSVAESPLAESVRFADGSFIRLRPLTPSDGRLVSDFLGQLSDESEYRRFLSSAGGVRSRWVSQIINADQRDSLAFGAVASNRFGQALVAVAESISISDESNRAEFALVALDSWQNLGIGTLLTRHVARVARATGVRFWETYMLGDNIRMARVMDHVGPRLTRSIDSGVAAMTHDLIADLDDHPRFAQS